MIKFEQYLLNEIYDWKKDLKNPAYDDGSHTEIDEKGNKIWLNDKGQLHRKDDKPARINPNGSMAWRINGKRHRENNKPALIFSGGARVWYINSDYIEPELKHYLTAIKDDPEYANHEQFEEFIKNNKEDIPLKDQEFILKHNPRLAKYIPNLDPKFKQTKKAADFGLF